MQFRIAQRSDRAALGAFFGRLSPETVLARYISPVNEAEHVVLLAVDGGEVRGVGEFVREGAAHAGLAMLVEDAYQHRHIGRGLFLKLEELALERGIQAFTGDVGTGNLRVARMLTRTGRRLQTRLGYASTEFMLQLAPTAMPAELAA
jgi:GNAT superfamily N-acetyltransferase